VSDASRWLEPVAEAARLAGRVALGYFKAGVAVEWKGDGTPVTVADRAAERAVREWIEARFQGDAVLGEEFGATGPSGGRRWLIDPIDGTKSFVAGVPLWGSLIAVMEGDTVVAGAVNCAAAGELVVAARGAGCWWNGERCAVSRQDELGQATTLTTDDRYPDRPERRARWAYLAERSRVVRTWGDCFGYVLVATGRADVMVDDRMNPWDAAPLLPIVIEAGGHFTDWRGEVTAFGGDSIATNAALSVAVRSILQEDPR
jgi:histidinol phosphatase-like enzyme (inositol monophosphatase family)